MDYRKANRDGEEMRLFRLIGLLLLGAYLGGWILHEIAAVRDAYDVELTNLLVGEVCGALCGLGVEALLRSRKLPNHFSLRFSLRELFIAVTLAACILGAFAILGR